MATTKSTNCSEKEFQDRERLIDSHAIAIPYLGSREPMLSRRFERVSIARGRRLDGTAKDLDHAGRHRPRRVVLDHCVASLCTETVSALGAFEEAGQFFDPIALGPSDETVLAMTNDLQVHPHGRHDGGNTQGHELKGLQAAFAARPVVIGKRHDAHVDVAQILSFARSSPGTCLDLDAPNGGWLGAYHQQSEAPMTRQLLESGHDRYQMLC